MGKKRFLECDDQGHNSQDKRRRVHTPDDFLVGSTFIPTASSNFLQDFFADPNISFLLSGLDVPDTFSPNVEVKEIAPSETAPSITLPKLSSNDIQRGSFIGYGRYGEVYRGIVDGKNVAIKILELGTSCTHEAEVLQQLAGAGGAPLLVGVTEDEPQTFAMELIQGITLKEYFPTSSRQQVKHTLRAIRKAVRELHKAGYTCMHNLSTLRPFPRISDPFSKIFTFYTLCSQVHLR